MLNLSYWDAFMVAAAMLLIGAAVSYVLTHARPDVDWLHVFSSFMDDATLSCVARLAWDDGLVPLVVRSAFKNREAFVASVISFANALWGEADSFSGERALRDVRLSLAPTADALGADPQANRVYGAREDH